MDIILNLLLPLYSLPLFPLKSPDYQVYLMRQYSPEQDPFKIVNNQLTLSPKLQTQITPEITKAKQELNQLSEKFSLKFTEELGIIYLHQGRENWLVKFTYGGIILNTSDPIILSTSEIFTLKKAFENTPLIEIEGIPYPTTQFMRQAGPILHE